jgi:hypothetical protein
MRTKTILKWSLMGGFSLAAICWIIYYSLIRNPYYYHTVEINAAILRERQRNVQSMTAYPYQTALRATGLQVNINGRDEGTGNGLFINTTKLKELNIIHPPTSTFPISKLHIDTLLKIRNVASFELKPDYYPPNRRYMYYRITPLDSRRNVIFVPNNPNYLELNPSPPAPNLGYEILKAN